MTDLRNRLTVLITVAGLIGFALATMVVDRRTASEGGRELSWWSGLMLDVAVPVQKAIALPVDVLRDAWDSYVALFSVRDENSELRHRLAELESENLQLREALVASGRLERIAEMRDGFDTPMLPAELVGVDVSPWFRSALIDRGRERGVLSGMPVMSDQGLVGLVRATSHNAARAMLLLDPQSAVDGTIQRSRARGMVRGRGEHLEFEFIAREADVVVDDVVITSGLDGVYPKGLRIGRITAVSDPGSKLLQVATVEPAVDFARLEQIFVLLRRGPTMELLYAADGDGEAPSDPPRPSS